MVHHCETPPYLSLCFQESMDTKTDSFVFTEESHGMKVRNDDYEYRTVHNKNDNYKDNYNNTYSSVPCMHNKPLLCRLPL